MGTCMSDKVSMGNFVTGCPRLDSTEEQIMNSWKLLEDGDINYTIPDIFMYWREIVSM